MAECFAGFYNCLIRLKKYRAGKGFAGFGDGSNACVKYL